MVDITLIDAYHRGEGWAAVGGAVRGGAALLRTGSGNPRAEKTKQAGIGRVADVSLTEKRVKLLHPPFPTHTHALVFCSTVR